MEKIKYVVQYDAADFAAEKRAVAQSAKNKSDFVSKAIAQAGYEVEIVSAAWTALDSGKFKGRHTKISENVSMTVCPTFGAKNRITRFLRMLSSMWWLFRYLVFNTKRSDVVFYYHSLAMARSVMWAKKVKGFKLILEANEKYSAVSAPSKAMRSVEERLLSCADGYLFCSNIADKHFGFNKPFAINHGTYIIPTEYPKADDGKIHIVYAGIIDTIKKGAFLALHAADFLDEKYVMHIAGTGKKDDVEKLKEGIAHFKGACGVQYDGVKIGEDYIKYISSMHIGLSTQSSEGEYLNYSFPSKILSYLSVNLRVVSSRIECVESSDIGDIMFYYESDSAQAIAEAIKKIDMKKPYDSTKRLRELSKKFCTDVHSLIDKVSVQK